jgi:hypothetical protein
MNSIDEFKNTERDLLRSHQFYLFGRSSGRGKSALFRNLHASCHSKGLLIAICVATSLADLGGFFFLGVLPYLAQVLVENKIK